jgi:hypothetical protein
MPSKGLLSSAVIATNPSGGTITCLPQIGNGRSIPKSMRYAAVWRDTMHHLLFGALPTGPECAPANRRAAKASTKAAGVKTVSTKAVTSVETTAVEAVEAAEAAMAAPAATARRYNVGCKHSKCCSRQQRDCDFTEHDQPSLVQEDDAHSSRLDRKVCKPLGVFALRCRSALRTFG